MCRILSTILGLALASAAGGALAQTYQSYGDAREGGYRYAHGHPDAPGGYVEEEEYHRADYPPPQAYYAPQPAYDYGYAQGGYAAPCSTCGGPVGGYEVPAYGYASQNYGWPGAMCGCGGELTYGYMGSEGYYGGVGGPASYGYSGGGGGGGGGYVYSGGGYGRAWSGAGASASARAYSSSSTSVRIGGGYHGGKGYGGKGH